MAVLRNHKSFWMRDDAEASLARWEADHGIIGVNSAGRTEREQQEFIDRWDKGGKYNRPPYLYEPKRPARASAHVANGGRAFDTSEWRRFLQTCGAYGWVQVYSWDVVHFEYFPERDQHRNRPAGGGSSKPNPTPNPSTNDEEEEDTMKAGFYKRSDGVAVQFIFDSRSGFYFEFTGQNPSTNSQIAQFWDTGSWPEFTASVGAAIKNACAEKRASK